MLQHKLQTQIVKVTPVKVIMQRGDWTRQIRERSQSERQKKHFASPFRYVNDRGLNREDVRDSDHGDDQVHDRDDVNGNQEGEQDGHA